MRPGLREVQAPSPSACILVAGGGKTMRVHLRHPVLATIMAALAVAATPCAHAGADADAVVDRYVAAIASQQDARVTEALARMDGTGRQLLALRSYLRSASHLAERWSWSQERIEAFEGSPEQRDLQLEISRVRTAFVAANPGYELYVNSQVRSLDVQIEHWNRNESVAAAADEILKAARTLIDSPGFPADRPEQAREALRAFLSGHIPVPPPTIAAPGLSLHGQMRAIDFQVHQGGRVVAGPSASTIPADWEAAGWAAKLQAAVHAGSNKFVGPLVSPPAPWHYTYVPDAAPAAAPRRSRPTRLARH
jgi:hypothetical protein